MKAIKLNLASVDREDENVYVMANNINHWYTSKICTNEVMEIVNVPSLGKVEVYRKLPATAVVFKNGSVIFVKERPEEIEKMLSE